MITLSLVIFDDKFFSGICLNPRFIHHLVWNQYLLWENKYSQNPIEWGQWEGKWEDSNIIRKGFLGQIYNVFYVFLISIYNIISRNMMRLQLSLCCYFVLDDGKKIFFQRCCCRSNFCALNLILNFLMDGGSGKMKEEFSQSYAFKMLKGKAASGNFQQSKNIQRKKIIKI